MIVNVEDFDSHNNHIDISMKNGIPNKCDVFYQGRHKCRLNTSLVSSFSLITDQLSGCGSRHKKKVFAIGALGFVGAALSVVGVLVM